MDLSLSEITDEAGLRALLEVAVADATPEETMPPITRADESIAPGAHGRRQRTPRIEDLPGWTEEKRRFFMEFFLPMVHSDEIVIFAVRVGGAVAGFMRLRRMPDAGTAETGMWLGRSFRGKGFGAAAFDALLAEAAKRGYNRVVADTLPHNIAALGVLRHGQARTREEGGKVYAEIAIDPGYATDLEK